MADVQMPSYDFYSKMLGEGPGGYAMASDQMDLARMFADQSLQQQQQRTLSDVMKNQQDEQMNPLLVEQQQLNNTGKGYSNDVAGVNARTATALEPDMLLSKKKELANSATQADLDGMYLHAQQMMGDPDPAKQLEGERIMNTHKDFMKLRLQGTNAATVAGIKGQATLENTNLRGSWQEKLAQIRAANSTAGKAPMTIAGAISKMKVNERLGAVKAILDTDTDPDTKTPLSPAARAYYESMYGQDTATANSNNARYGQGTMTQVTPDESGKPKISIVNKTAPTVKTPSKDANTGTTKNGVKFKVISN